MTSSRRSCWTLICSLVRVGRETGVGTTQRHQGPQKDRERSSAQFRVVMRKEAQARSRALGSRASTRLNVSVTVTCLLTLWLSYSELLTSKSC